MAVYAAHTDAFMPVPTGIKSWRREMSQPATLATRINVQPSGY